MSEVSKKYNPSEEKAEDFVCWERTPGSHQGTLGPGTCPPIPPHPPTHTLASILLLLHVSVLAVSTKSAPSTVAGSPSAVAPRPGSQHCSCLSHPASILNDTNTASLSCSLVTCSLPFTARKIQSTRGVSGELWKQIQGLNKPSQKPEVRKKKNED